MQNCSLCPQLAAWSYDMASGDKSYRCNDCYNASTELLKGYMEAYEQKPEYEFIAMVKDSQNGTWALAGQDNSVFHIADVASYIACMDHEHFSYLCRPCLDNRAFLKTLQSRGYAQRVQQHPDGTWTMEIAQKLSTEYPTGKGSSTPHVTGSGLMKHYM